jgi:hypothetical protein
VSMDDPVPQFIHDLERILSVAIILEDIDDGPPVVITAAGMVDADSSTFVGRGDTEDAAWRDLAVAIASWRNMDPRTIRTFIGGI